MIEALLKFWYRVRALGRSRTARREIDEELRFHLERRTAENIEAGMPPEEAVREARKRFGNLQSVREECRETVGAAWMGRLFQDLRFGARLWRKQPGSFLSAVAALTLGLGLVTFTVSTINCIFLGKLPFPDPQRLVYASLPTSDLRAYQEQQTTFEALSAFGSGTANFKAIDAPSRRRVCYIGANFLDVVRAKPLSGRGFLPGDGKAGADPVALIGFDLWQNEFHGSSAAIGSVIRLDGQPRTVVGIMPVGFKFPIDDQIWIPVESGSAQMSGWGYGFGRLKASATLADARMELNVIAARLTAADGKAHPPSKNAILVGPYTRYLSDSKGSFGPAPAVFAMLIVTLLVLFIACANVAGLTLANAAKRGTELAVRGALGATRARLVLQMLIENLILAVSGGVGSLVIIAMLSRWFAGWIATSEAELGEVPFWMRIEVDGRLLLALVGLIFFTNLLAGLWPALQATKRDVNELLKAGTGSISGARGGKLQWLLVMVQIAFAVVVLSQSFVLLTFSRHLTQSQLPFNPTEVFTAQVSLPASVEARSFFDSLERNLAGLPGVKVVVFSTSSPTLGHPWRQIAVEGNDYPRPQDHPYAGSETISAGYFQALNATLLQGRGFNANDTAGSLPVVIVNATFARMFLTPGNPLGHRIQEGTNAWLTIVGCVPDLEYDPSAPSHQPVYFQPLAQQPASSMVVTLRGAGPALDWAKAVGAEVARLQPDLAIYHVATMQMLIMHQVIGYYLASLLLGICGVGSLFLATLGIYGLISLSVTQRTREIGVRLALGATRPKIVVALLRKALWQIVAGLAVGTILAIALNQLLVHSISDYPTVADPALVFLGTVVFLGTISLIAVLIPALRGARVEPMVALRYE